MTRGEAKALMWAGAGITALLGMQQMVRRSRRYDFRGRVVLITGASRGLGLILARLWAEEGARLAICARDGEDLDTARRELSTTAEVASFECDIMHRADIERMLREVEGELGPVDVLVNNAGTIAVGPFETMTVEDFDDSLRTHFWGPLHAIQGVLPAMRERGEGRIVNVSSIGGRIGVPHMAAYCAGKFALTGFSQALRAELLPHGICVTTVIPGLITTGSPRNAHFKGQHEAEYAWFAAADSMPGLAMDAEAAGREVVEAARYGEAEVILGKAAELASLFNGVFPGLTADLLSVAQRFLPSAEGGIGTEKALGSESESNVTQSPLTERTRRAEEKFNQR
ncbi:MAG: SDR family NAD(P)-dependent oxidoreductase [Bryobacteraceae bacterium]|nr:SDR family NAD(P)-dependent oxidoreductase [Bryobacteraceae bacterium]